MNTEIWKASSSRLVDAHCHLYEFPSEEVEKYQEYRILAVSDNFESSLKTLKLAERFDNVIPCIGLHPWEVRENCLEEVEQILKLAPKALCLGEIGLDKLFTPQTFKLQLKVFSEFLKFSKEYELPVNVHAAGAWREVYDLIRRYDIEKAVFHWYSGPLDLLEEIVGSGYFITINPTVTINKKHMRALQAVELENVLTESDGPYKYRGFYLKPELVKEVVKTIAKVKEVEVENVVAQVYRNLERFLF
ncbi:MAG: TatD family deoxyribonuclease [Thermoprotei archaeon]|nr:MAG: TatD family deoxyribonuclease [Thermoprotei archaeon]